jgi:hypothetical protein
MEMISLAREIAKHPRWHWHGMMGCTDETGQFRAHYSYMPADIEALPELTCSRVTGRMLADIFLLAQEVHQIGNQLRVIMSPGYECVATGVYRVASCWLSMSRWLVAQEAKKNG